MEGYTVGGLYIPGTYYFYLNYTQVEKKNEKTGRRQKDFPIFTDVQLEYFLHLENARKKQKGFIFVKPRRIGASYMSGASISHEYTFFPDSKCIISAYQKDLAQNTMKFALNDLNFLDIHTPFGKERNPDRSDYVMARYRKKMDDGREVWAGYMSEIEVITFQDNPFASIGRSSNLFLFEEVGRFDNIISSYNISEPCWKDGDDLIGIPIVQGCVCAGTKVWNNKGHLVNIEELKIDEGILGLNNQKASEEEITYLKPPSKKPCYRITTNTGNILECSDDHPILWSKHKHFFIERKTENGKRIEVNRYKKVEFKETKDVIQGDHVAIINSISIFDNEEFWEPRIVGMLIGDGAYGLDKTPVFSNCDIELNDYIYSKLDCITEKEYLTKSGKQYKETRIRNICPNLRELGIYGQTKFRKRLPKKVFRTSKENVCEFLGGLIDTDGCVREDKKGNINIVYSSVVVDLIKEVKFLFSKIGVHGSISSGYMSSDPNKLIKDVNPCYNFVISDSTSLFNFYKNIHLLVQYKQDRINKIPLSNRKSKDVSKKVFVKKGEKNKKYLELTDVEGIRFEIVKKIEYIGEQFVYNLTAGTTHTYIANNIVTHNTGGDMTGGTEGFSEMFYNPSKYNLLAFPDIWDEDAAHKNCGWFIPATRQRFGKYKDEYKEHPEWKDQPMVDKFGNSIENIAKQSILDLRKRVNQGIDEKAKIDAITQYPLTPNEAFLISERSRFPILKLKNTLLTLTDLELNKHQVGKLTYKEGVLIFQDVQGAKPCREYPVSSYEQGCIEMYETPRKDNDNTIINNRYVIGVDPYKYDVAKTNSSNNSLGCILVFDRLTRRVVCEYTGRPEKTDEFYELVRRLCLYYNATCMYESNITNLYQYFDNKRCLHLLADTPHSLRDRNVWKAGTNFSKGIMANKQVNEKGLEFVENYLLEKQSEESDELMCERLRSVGLIKELILWSPDLNTDRISALTMALWYDVSLSDVMVSDEVRQRQKNKYGTFFNKFKKNSLNDEIMEKILNRN